MPYHRTVRRNFTPSLAPPAHGLHVHGTRTTYHFVDLCDAGDPAAEIVIGRHLESDIHLADKSVSLEHAVIRPCGEDLWEIHDRSRDGKPSRNGVLINGKPMVAPTVLRAGMRVRIGKTRFHGANERLMVPITACTLTEFCHRLDLIYGNSCEAERRMGPEEKKREFIRTHALDWRKRHGE